MNQFLLKTVVSVIAAVGFSSQCFSGEPNKNTDPGTTWPEYGGPIQQSDGKFTMGAGRSTAKIINKNNLSRLDIIGEFEWSHDPQLPQEVLNKKWSTSGTPLHVQATVRANGGQLEKKDFLYVCTSYNDVVKLGGNRDNLLQPLKTFTMKPFIKVEKLSYKCRGLAYWKDPSKEFTDTCGARIYMGTMDGRMYSLDANTLEPCSDFGDEAESAKSGSNKKLGYADLGKGVGARKEISDPNDPEYGKQFEFEYYLAQAPLIYPLGKDVLGADGRPGKDDKEDALLIVGGGVMDSLKVKVASGAVRGFDARTGRLVFVWDTVPQRIKDRCYTPEKAMALKKDKEKKKNVTLLKCEEGLVPGTPNVWAQMAADFNLQKVYLPTGNASPDYYSGVRKHVYKVVNLEGEETGETENLRIDDYASGLVAMDMQDISNRLESAQPGSDRVLEARLSWSRQFVYNDVWDFDSPSQPILTDMKIGRRNYKVIIQTTKMGYIFFMDRQTGEWLPGSVHSVEEVDAPKTESRKYDKFVATHPRTGERIYTDPRCGIDPPENDKPKDYRPKKYCGTPDEIAPKQPRPAKRGFRLHPDKKSMSGVTWKKHPKCRAKMNNYYYRGMFTPATANRETGKDGTLHYPGPAGGGEWGGASLLGNTLFVNINRYPFFSKLVHPDDVENGERPNGSGRFAMRRMYGADHDFRIFRWIFKADPDPGSEPDPDYHEALKTWIYCTKPPWGQLIAVDIKTGRIKWGANKAFGNYRKHLSIRQDKPHSQVEDTINQMYPGDHFFREFLLAKKTNGEWKNEPGTTNIGGSAVTDEGLLFIGATGDGVFRVIDTESGETLREFDIPNKSSAMGNPMTYQTADGKDQFVVFPAGGNPYSLSIPGRKFYALGLTEEDKSSKKEGK